MSVVSTFGVTRHQLTELMGQRGPDALAAVAEYGGVSGVMEAVDTNTKTGLSNNSLELETRKTMFGVNYIKPIAPKSFLALCFDAIQDKTLIILIVAALVSIVLGVAVEEDKVRLLWAYTRCYPTLFCNQINRVRQSDYMCACTCTCHVCQFSLCSLSIAIS